MRIVSIFFVLACAVLTANVTASAQRNVTPAIDRDPLLEQDAKHNLEVAKQAFLLKKAYKGVLMRFEETFAAYPTFSKMDEFLYLAGMSSFYLSENKGRQKIDLNAEKRKEKYAPAKLREDAVAYLSILVEKYPESRYRGEAQEALARIKPKE
ncbi:MAG: outer membrane protein assembly factor BamD [Acidobacteria bacterium]|nr:outer membrane protein assembly factor BamD [Acidobacteriota bacterium]